MLNSLKFVFIGVLILIFFSSGTALAIEVTGKIDAKSRKASTIQMTNLKTKQKEIVRFDKKTKFINAKSINSLIVNDKIKVDFEPGKPARSIERVLIVLPKHQIVGTKELETLVAKKPGSFSLYDARPAKRYDEGHLPGAISMPVDLVGKNPGLLGKDKNRLLVFYCGGPT